MLATIPKTQKYESKRWLRVPQPLADAQQFLFHTSLWCVCGSEETILVFEASELIESETSRVSCFAWKSQNLKDAPKERVAFKHNTLQRREMLALIHLQKASLNRSLLIFASSESWAASSMNRNRNLIQPSSMPLIRKRHPASKKTFCLEVMVRQENPHSLLESSGGGGGGVGEL